MRSGTCSQPTAWSCATASRRPTRSARAVRSCGEGRRSSCCCRGSPCPSSSLRSPLPGPDASPFELRAWLRTPAVVSCSKVDPEAFDLLSGRERGALERYTRDLTTAALRDELEPVRCRDAETDQVV